MIIAWTLSITSGKTFLLKHQKKKSRDKIVAIQWPLLGIEWMWMWMLVKMILMWMWIVVAIVVSVLYCVILSCLIQFNVVDIIVTRKTQ
jgi:hypothetical protein